MHLMRDGDDMRDFMNQFISMDNSNCEKKFSGGLEGWLKWNLSIKSLVMFRGIGG